MSAVTVIPQQVAPPAFEVVDLTPDLAQEFLGHNLRNRDKKDIRIQLYARDITAGDWRFTGESIKFDYNGNLIDGQNRCYAVIEAGRAITVLVVRGLDPESQEVMDSNAIRNTGDALGLHGYEQRVLLAATISVHAVWEGDHYKNCMSNTNSVWRPTNAEAVKYVVHRPELVEATSFASRTRKSLPGVSIGALATAFYELSAIDAAATDDFFGRIVGLQTHGKGDPIHTLIKRFTEMRERRTRVLPATSLFMLFRSWNAVRDGAELQKFQFGRESRWATIPKPH